MLLKVFKCVYCDVRFVVMKTQTNTFLPVEVAEKQTYDDSEIFNYRIHKSHLLNCEKRRYDWDKIKRKFEQAESIEITLALSKMLD